MSHRNANKRTWTPPIAWRKTEDRALSSAKGIKKSREKREYMDADSTIIAAMLAY
jgi:hypothetical protein